MSTSLPAPRLPVPESLTYSPARWHWKRALGFRTAWNTGKVLGHLLKTQTGAPPAIHGLKREAPQHHTPSVSAGPRMVSLRIPARPEKPRLCARPRPYWVLPTFTYGSLFLPRSRVNTLTQAARRTRGGENATFDPRTPRTPPEVGVASFSGLQWSP